MAKDSTAPAAKKGSTRTGTRGAREAQAGDTAPRLGARAIERHVVRQSTLGKQEAQGEAVRDLLRRAAKSAPADTLDALNAMLSGASPDDLGALKRLLLDPPGGKAAAAEAT